MRPSVRRSVGSMFVASYGVLDFVEEVGHVGQLCTSMISNIQCSTELLCLKPWLEGSSPGFKS